MIHLIIEAFTESKPLTAKHFRKLCSGYASVPESLSENSTQEMVFLKDQILETIKFCESSVLEWDELPFETSSVRSMVSNSPLRGVQAVNVREGFYIQFNEISNEIASTFAETLEDEKFIYR
jgi:hypothetical protein